MACARRLSLALAATCWMLLVGQPAGAHGRHTKSVRPAATKNQNPALTPSKLVTAKSVTRGRVLWLGRAASTITKAKETQGTSSTALAAPLAKKTVTINLDVNSLPSNVKVSVPSSDARTTVMVNGAEQRATAPATVNPIPSAASQKRAQSRALKTVKDALTPWIPAGGQLTLRPAMVPFGGDQRNPITGTGPIEIHADVSLSPTSGLWSRLTNMFNKKAHSTFFVQVDRLGRTQILAQESATPQARLFYAIEKVFPIRELAADFIKSDGVRKAVATAVVGMLAWQISPVVAGGSFVTAAKMAYDGVTRRQEARRSALDATVAMAQEQKKTKNEYPTLQESYRYFQNALQIAKPGTTPWSITSFTEKLALSGL